MELHVNQPVHLINIMDQHQKEFYNLVSTVQQVALHVQVLLHVQHVIVDMPYQDLYVNQISQENYKSVISS